MNANELADKLLDDTLMDYQIYEYVPEIVAMLRQQQAEIEALKKENKELVYKCSDNLLIHLKEQSKRYEDLLSCIYKQIKDVGVM